MKLFTSYFGFLLLASYSFATAKAECVLRTVSSYDAETPTNIIFSCTDSEADDFIYTAYHLKTPTDSTIEFQFQNISISNTYIINAIQHLTQSARDLRSVMLKISNNLTDLNVEKIVKNIPKLTVLDVSRNKLTTLPVVENSTIEYLNLANNELNELFVNYSLGNLNILDLSSCGINKIGKYVFRRSHSMNELDLNNNNIKSLNSSLALVCDLEILDLRNNLIEVLNESDICHVSQIYLENNRLFTINFDFESFPFEKASLDVVHLGKLDKISISLEIRYLPYENVSYELDKVFIQNEKLNSLPPYAFEPHNNHYIYTNKGLFYLSNCSLTLIYENAFNGLTGWHKLRLSSNKIKTLINNSFNNTKLEILDLSYSGILSLEPNVFYGALIQEINLQGNNITKINSNIFCNTGVIVLDLSHNNLEIFDYLACENSIEKLNLQGNKIKSIDNLGNFENLIYLDVSHNKIDKLDQNFAYYFSNIRYLNLSNNQIDSILPNSFSALENLESLSLENNKLTSLDSLMFSYENFKLQALNLSINGILEAESFSRLSYLRSLFLINSKISLVKNRSFFGLVRVNVIQLDNATIDKIEFGAFSGLVSLQESDFSIILKNVTKLENGLFKGLNSMLELNISFTTLEEIDHNAFEGLENLSSLILTNNPMRDLAIGSFINLETLRSLYLNNNKLTKLSLGTFYGLENLELLDLSFNSLQVIKSEVLFPLRSLLHLDLTSNEVIELNHQNVIENHKSLRYLGLRDNLFKCEYLLLLLGNLTAADVYYKSSNPTDTQIINIDGIYCVDICDFVYCPEDDQYHLYNPEIHP